MSTPKNPATMTKAELLASHSRPELLVLAQSVGHRGIGNVKKEVLAELYLMKATPPPAPPLTFAPVHPPSPPPPPALDSQSTDSEISFLPLDDPSPKMLAWRHYDDVAKVIYKRVKSCTSEWHLLRLIYQLNPSRVRILRLTHHNKSDELDHFTLNVNTSNAGLTGGVSYHVYFTMDESRRLHYRYVTVLRGTQVEVCAEF